jgi:hypothetical protein
VGVFDDDLSFITADVFSSAVVFGSQSTTGILDESTALPGADGLVYEVTGHVLTLQAGSLTGLAEDSRITVAGTEYVVRRISPSVDGRALTVVLVPYTT